MHSNNISNPKFRNVPGRNFCPGASVQELCRPDPVRSTLAFTDGSGSGSSNASSLILGSYLHGIFDSDPFRCWFINRLRQRKGLVPLSGISAFFDLKPAFDRLTGIVHESVDMSRIYRLLGL
jgi:cobyric acid synthase